MKLNLLRLLLLADAAVLFVLGALFIGVTLFLPNGLIGLLKRKKP